MPYDRPSPITIVLIDADDIAREGVAAHLTADPLFRLLRAARSVAEAQLERLHPALVCCDPRGRGGSGLDMIEAIAAAAPDAGICIWTTESDPSFVLDAGQANLGLYLLKGSVNAADLLTMLELVARTGVVIIDGIVAARFRDRRQGRLVLQQPSPEAATLTERELEVLRLYGGDQRVEEIAQRLHIDHRTVSGHLTNARRKLGAGTNAKLVRLATEQGLFEP